MKWITVNIICFCLQSVLPSYLGYPRVHFAGQFRADPNTRNNDFCNYRMDKPLNPDLNGVDWNANGTHEFQFVNARVTSVVYRDGTVSTTDSIIGHTIVDNLDKPPAKISDSNFNNHAIIYGLNFGIKWNDDFPGKSCDVAFYGKWKQNILTQFSWKRMMCYGPRRHGGQLMQNSFSRSAQSATVITDIDWRNLGNSEALAQLREAVGDGDLSVRISVFYFTRNYPPYVAHNATLGYVVGAIGVPSPSDTLNVPGERGMFHKSNPIGLTFDSSDLCYKQNLSGHTWTNFAPFEVDKNRNEVRVDLSNSIPADFSNSLRDIGTLRLGIFTDFCVYLLGSEQGLPYASTDDLPITSAIYTVPVKPSLMNAIANHSLVIVQVLANEKGCNRICGKRWTTNSKESVQILLQEYPYFIRPKDLYSHRLDRETNPTSSQMVYVTRYGKTVQEAEISAIYYPNTEFYGPPVPAYGVIPTTWTATTDKNGLATFHFKLNENIKIPRERHYSYQPCTDSTTTVLPYEGQAYYYYYCINIAGMNCEDYRYIVSFFLAFSDVSYTRPYTWVDDVGPIFKQYAHIAAVMRKVLDLSSYSDVTSPHNLHLLNRTLRLDFDDPSYMPTTRDLSPAKIKMILEWLEDPRYDLSGSTPRRDLIVYNPQESWSRLFRAREHFSPYRCRMLNLRFEEAPYDHDSYFSYILNNAKLVTNNNLKRPLFTAKNCSIANLRKQLQTAVELEWATVPVYLTALYSIKEGFNVEIYNITRSVIMQEMLHMTQSANILIAMNGSPLIDDARVNPSFPFTGLPGGVLPNLLVSLEKLSLTHVYQVFMGIEVPQKSFVGYPISNNKTTIGMFYTEIKDCINYLGDDIFDPTMLDRQVKWPWTPTEDLSNVLLVTDSASATRAIDTIVSQGEGATILNPDEVNSKTLAHFFKFEEIVCQKRLEKVDDFHYAYKGAPIPFDSKGVWPMRSNPKASNILPHTNCYTESRVFHQVYNTLLRKLQEVFNGRPNDIFVAVQLMESLQVHAKRLMWIKFRPDDADDDTTCGPVWDYSWPEN